MGTPLTQCTVEKFHGYVCIVRGSRLYIISPRVYDEVMVPQGCTRDITRYSDFVYALKSGQQVERGDMIKQRSAAGPRVHSIIKQYRKRYAEWR